MILYSLVGAVKSHFIQFIYFFSQDALPYKHCTEQTNANLMFAQRLSQNAVLLLQVT